MKLCLITPIEHLDYTTRWEGRFCLAPVVNASPAYADFFVQERQLKYDVILDNGIFETAELSHQQLIDAWRKTNANIIVLPDRINSDGQENIQLAEAALATFNRTVPDIMNTSFMYVPQISPEDANPMTSLIEQYKWILKTPCVQWLGICRDMVYQVWGRRFECKDQELNRLRWGDHFLTYFQQAFRDAGKKVHFLGLGERFDLLSYAWYVDSCDCASAFWQPLQGTQAKNGVLPTILKRPFDYFYRYYPMLLEQYCDELETTLIAIQQQADIATRNAMARTGGRI